MSKYRLGAWNVAGRKEPRHSLDKVRALAPKRSFILAKSRALDPLCVHCGSPLNAYAFARNTLSQLDVDAFAETAAQRFDQEFDVYGKLTDEVLWYIKLTIDLDSNGDEYLLVLSFHAAERPMRTNGGELTP